MTRGMKGLNVRIAKALNRIWKRKGQVIAIVNHEDDAIDGLADHVICIPHTLDFLSPMLTSIPLQLLAYHIAVLRGCNVDQPRNLAKSVTVE